MSELKINRMGEDFLMNKNLSTLSPFSREKLLPLINFCFLNDLKRSQLLPIKISEKSFILDMR
jgi:hypothetical protein